MEEMGKNMLAKQAELAEMELTIRRRQMLLDLTSREVEESMHKLKDERERMKEERVRKEEPANCTENSIRLKEQVKKESRISGLKVMGVLLFAAFWLA
jgi:hypothetical protein